MHLVILVNNSKKNTNKYVHTDDNENNKEQIGPSIAVMGWHPVENDFKNK